MQKKSIMQRVDLQVAMLVTLFVIISSLVIFYFSYTLSYRQMLDSLAERVESIALYVDATIPASIFTDVNSVEDMDTETYKKAKKFLSEIKKISTAQYLYTAKRSANGKLIYHIDGLPQADKDFRKTGDLIEPVFQKDLIRALNDEVVMPRRIKNTEWGDVLVAYYPFHDVDNKTVIGAIGIEFPATREYQAFMYIRNMTPFVILMTCVVAFFVSRMLFRRLSNPHFQDISNTDALTSLKNRNAYELDIENFLQSVHLDNYALVLADLNCLKIINDTYGHKAGDNYIKKFASVLMENSSDSRVNYRIGGDEFAIFFFNPTEEVVLQYIDTIKEELAEKMRSTVPYCGVAVGYAFCSVLDSQAWEKTQIEADTYLYNDKRAFYDSHEEFNKRKY